MLFKQHILPLPSHISAPPEAVNLPGATLRHSYCEWKGEEERRENMAECSGRDPEIFQLSKKTKSDVWPYFGFYKKAEGKLIEDDHRLQDMPKENSSERGKRIKPYESPLRPPPATF